MTKQLDGKIVLVTGGASGIGRATALAFSREGAKVVIADVLVEGGEETVGMIKGAGGEAMFVKTDVSKTTEVETLISKTVQKYKRLDCAFNNSGITGTEMAPLAELTENNFDRIISVNLKGVWLCLKYEIPQMIKQGGGAIVNTASIDGLRGNAFTSAAYVASKHGVLGLTKNAALDYAKAGIRVNAVCPGGIRTAIYEQAERMIPQLDAALKKVIPMGRAGEPEEIAHMVVFLCTDKASYLTGESIVIDGGFRIQ